MICIFFFIERISRANPGQRTGAVYLITIAEAVIIRIGIFRIGINTGVVNTIRSNFSTVKQAIVIRIRIIGISTQNGFLGMGEEHYPVPWKKLSYDVSQNGFLTDITEEQVKGAPATNEGWTEDRAWEERTHQHYRTDPYWL